MSLPGLVLFSEVLAVRQSYLLVSLVTYVQLLSVAYSIVD